MHGPINIRFTSFISSSFIPFLLPFIPLSAALLLHIFIVHSFNLSTPLTALTLLTFSVGNMKQNTPLQCKNNTISHACLLTAIGPDTDIKSSVSALQNITTFHYSWAFSVSRKRGHIGASDFTCHTVLTTEHSSVGGNIYLARFMALPVYVLRIIICDTHITTDIRFNEQEFWFVPTSATSD